MGTWENMPRQIFGIDFSGARDAGRKIWVASGTVEYGTLLIGDCFSASGLPGSVVSRDQHLAAAHSINMDLTT
jgi:hypothetical protein